MPSRSAALSLLLLFAPVSAQPPQKLPPMKSFKLTNFNMTFIYPAEFVPAEARAIAPASYTLPNPRPADPACVQVPLTVGSNAPGNSALVLSVIDDSCPDVLHGAQKLGDFTRSRLLHQLEHYGTPILTLSPRLYTLDGHPAALVEGSSSSAGAQASTTYAVKLCLFGGVPDSGIPRLHHQTPDSEVICIDFTTRQKEQLAPLLDLPIIFGDDAPRVLVPASVLR